MEQKNNYQNRNTKTIPKLLLLQLLIFRLLNYEFMHCNSMIQAYNVCLICRHSYTNLLVITHQSFPFHILIHNISKANKMYGKSTKPGFLISCTKPGMVTEIQARNEVNICVRGHNKKTKTSSIIIFACNSTLRCSINLPCTIEIFLTVAEFKYATERNCWCPHTQPPAHRWSSF